MTTTDLHVLQLRRHRHAADTADDFVLLLLGCTTAAAPRRLFEEPRVDGIAERRFEARV
jgi:hypothetical protein